MGKEKVKKGVPNKHLHARIAYLRQVSEHLTRIASSRTEPVTPPDNGDAVAATKPDPGEGAVQTRELTHRQQITSGLPILLSSHLKTIAQKVQIRLSPDIKHSICKTCSAPLLEGLTSAKSVENLSKGGRKPWADVVMVECMGCGTKKRFPVGATRQKRKGLRTGEKREVEPGKGTDVIVGDACEGAAVDANVSVLESNGGKQDVVMTA